MSKTEKDKYTNKTRRLQVIEQAMSQSTTLETLERMLAIALKAKREQKQGRC